MTTNAWRLNEDTNVAFQPKKALVKDEATGLTYEVDGIGATILDHADGKTALDEIARVLANTFNVNTV